MELLSVLPETRERAAQELSLQLMLAPALSFVTGPQSVEHIYARARELARQVGGTPELFPVLAGLAHAKIVRGHMREARALAEEFLELAGPQQDSLVVMAGHWLLAYAAWWQGDVVDVRDHSRQGLAFYNPDQHRAGIAAYNINPRIVCGYLSALADWVLGYPTQAAHGMERTLAHAHELEHPDSVGISLLFSAQLSQLRREPEPARTRAEEARALSAQRGLPALELWCLLPRGWAVAQQGDVSAGIADIKEAMDRRRAFGMGAVWPWFYALLADAYGALGQKCFEQALAVARDQQAKSWELRAAMSMSRMWLDAGRVDDARALLTPIYDWFTEGFDTADLMEANALLEQLS